VEREAGGGAEALPSDAAVAPRIDEGGGGEATPFPSLLDASVGLVAPAVDGGELPRDGGELDVDANDAAQIIDPGPPPPPVCLDLPVFVGQCDYYYRNVVPARVYTWAVDAGVGVVVARR
jgi:hypothetical protein